MMKKALVLSLAALMAVILVGCSSSVPYSDTEDFVSWVHEDRQYNSNMTDKVAEAVRDDFSGYSLESIATAARTHITEISRPECEAFKLKGKYADIQKEYIAFLTDLSFAFLLAAQAGKDLQNGRYSEANGHAEACALSADEATEHMNTVLSLIAALSANEIDNTTNDDWIEVTVPIMFENATNVGIVNFQLSFDPDVLHSVGVDLSVLPIERKFSWGNTYEEGVKNPIIQNVRINGNGTLLEWVFRVHANTGSSTLAIVVILARDADTNELIETKTSDGSYSTSDMSFQPPVIVFGKKTGKMFWD